jgi:hypothetical protein
LNALLKKHGFRHDAFFYDVFSLKSNDQLLVTTYMHFDCPSCNGELRTKKYTLIEINKLTKRVGILNKSSSNIGVSINTNKEIWGKNAPLINVKLCVGCSKYTFWPKGISVDQVNDWSSVTSYDFQFYRTNKEDEKIIIEVLSEVFD